MKIKTINLFKVALLFVIALIFANIQICPIRQILAETPIYARVKYSSVMLYKNPSSDSDYSNVYFSIPQTYFVEVLSKHDSNFFKAKYMDTIGYIKRSEIDFVAGSPVTPYANKISFRVFAQNGLNLRTSPVESEGITNRIATIPFLECNLQYIGQIEGEEVIRNRGNVWYYCKYLRGDEMLNGYVYAGYCDMLTPILDNLEVMQIIDEPSFENTSSVTDISPEKENAFNKLSQKSQIIIIVSVCVPALLILFLLFKPTRIIASSKSAAKKSSDTKKKKKRYRDDYYEIDD